MINCIKLRVHKSFCTINRAVEQMQALTDMGAEVVPIMSGIVYSTDTRFGGARELCERVMRITGKEILKTVRDAEPIGPKKLLDLLLIAPCTGCTLAKVAGGIADTSVTMAYKAHTRNGRPTVIAVSTNDGLACGARNIGELLNRRNIYFVPFGQDDPEKKPTSLVADMSKIPETVRFAFDAKQLQPILC